jgi:hypothetical protein
MGKCEGKREKIGFMFWVFVIWLGFMEMMWYFFLIMFLTCQTGN